MIRRSIFSFLLCLSFNHSKSCLALENIALRHSVFAKKYDFAKSIIKKTKKYQDLNYKKESAIFLVATIRDIQKLKDIFTVLFKKFGRDIDPNSTSKYNKTIFQYFLEEESLLEHERSSILFFYIELSLRYSPIKSSEIMNYIYTMSFSSKNHELSKKYQILFQRFVTNFKIYPESRDTHKMDESRQKRRNKTAKVHPLI